MVDLQVLVVMGSKTVIVTDYDTAWNGPMLNDKKKSVPILLVHTNHEDFLLVKLLPTTKHPLTINMSTMIVCQL